MKKNLIELLNITGHSGQEEKVIEYLIPILYELVDNLEIDDYLNLLGKKKCGSGKGATILLSAHMDTVKAVKTKRKIIEIPEENIIMADGGALGADDRAGIAIILEVLRQLNNLNFDGVIKVAFTREEEVGLIGSGKIDQNFYKDVDLAIVVDRRGNRDIVVGGGGVPFCADNVGEFLEECAKLTDMNWKCVKGGVSDALTFSDNGINSVNLSAGYYNEHTEMEYVNVTEMYDTVKFILQIIAVINSFVDKFDPVPTFSNKWIKPKNKTKYPYYGYDYYFEDDFFDYGYQDDTLVYQFDGNIYVEQNGNQIILTPEVLEIIKDLSEATKV